MGKPNPVLAIATLSMSVLSMPSALHAQAKGDPHPRGGMMDVSPGTMGGHMMESCHQMMQGSSAKPNEQWKQSTPEPADRSDKKR